MTEQGNWFGQAEYQGWPQFDYSQPQTQPGSSAYNNQRSFYGGGNNQGTTPQMFIPQYDTGKGGAAAADDYENKPPLLDYIRQKTFAVLNPVGTASAEVIADQDLAGPLVFCLLFGAYKLYDTVLQGYSNKTGNGCGRSTDSNSPSP